MLDLKAQHEPLNEEIRTAVRDILDSSRFILGPNVSSFEQEVAAYHNVTGAVGLGSGTDALYLSLRALDIKEGDEVITTPFTFIASVNSILFTGATPVFVDVDPETFNIDPALVEQAITPRTKAILPVHLYGYVCDMDALQASADKHG